MEYYDEVVEIKKPFPPPAPPQQLEAEEPLELIESPAFKTIDVTV